MANLDGTEMERTKIDGDVGSKEDRVTLDNDMNILGNGANKVYAVVAASEIRITPVLTPVLTDIKTVDIKVLSYNNEKASIDAQNMTETTEFWSTDSRAELVIEDIRHNSSSTTIGMRVTDVAVDYSVYFDPTHITNKGVILQGGEYLSTLTQVNIELDHVGIGSIGGDLSIGNMSIYGQGIQQFNIEVDRVSWIDTLSSTNNSLESVKIANIDMNGAIRIEHLKDLRTLDASGMKMAKYSNGQDAEVGVVTVGIELTSDSVSKYLGYKGEADFSYITGAGNDHVKVRLDSYILKNAGVDDKAEVNIEVNTGAGNDLVDFYIVKSNSGDISETLAKITDGNWYANHKLHSSFVIHTGEGNDIVNLPGIGNFTVDTGSGDDRITLSLSTQDSSNLVLSSMFGKNTIVNFSDNDKFDVTYYAKDGMSVVDGNYDASSDNITGGSSSSGAKQLVVATSNDDSSIANIYLSSGNGSTVSYTFLGSLDTGNIEVDADDFFIA